MLLVSYTKNTPAPFERLWINSPRAVIGPGVLAIGYLPGAVSGVL